MFGRNIFAVGGGEKVAKLSGIKVKRLKVFVFMTEPLWASQHYQGLACQSSFIMPATPCKAVIYRGN